MNNEAIYDMIKPLIIKDLADLLSTRNIHEIKLFSCDYCRASTEILSGTCEHCGAPLPFMLPGMSYMERRNFGIKYLVAIQ